MKFNLFLIIFAALSIFSFGAKWSRDLKDREIAQKEMYSATEWLNENAKATPPRKRARIGVFNAGIQAYFSNHQVINLDGLISFQATDAIKNHTLWAYIKSLEILYISDYDIYMTYRYKDFFGISQDELFKNLEPINKIHIVDAGAKLGSEGISIYKVR